MDATGNGVAATKADETTTTTAAAEPSAERELTPRDLRLLEISQRRREERDNGLQEAPAEEAGEAPEATAAPAPAAPAATAAAPAASPEPEVFEKDGKKHIRLKVYGEVQEIPLGEAVRRAQKDVAFDRRMEQAAERENRALLMEQQARSQLERITAAAKAVPPQQPGATEEQKVALHATLEKLYNGDIETAAKELETILSTGRQQATPANPDLIAAQVEERLQQSAAAREQSRRIASYKAAEETFREEYPELAKDPRLYKFVDAETELLMQSEPELSPLEMVRKAAQTVRDMVTPKPPSAPSRTSHKQTMPKAVTGASTPSVSTTIEAPPPRMTPAQKIAELRKARGQA